MIAIILVQEKEMPVKLPVNPRVFLICAPNESYPSKEYTDGEVAKMMREAELTAFSFSAEKGRLAVVNYHETLGFRLICSMAVKSPDSGADAFEFYMEMPSKITK